MHRYRFSLTVSERANQELQNAFLDKFLAQKKAKIWGIEREDSVHVVY